jgi:4-hydroxybenzoate polyprenyltransferase
MSLIDYGRFVKFSHTVFALPFVLATMAIASLEKKLTVEQIILILLAMATARSAAMGINRIIDRNIDAKNKRTQNRELVTGKISLRNAKIFVMVNSLLFWAIAATFNYITLLCAPIILILFYIYPYLKRVTWLSHFFLGFVDGLAPIATWIALFGDVSPSAFFLGLAMMCWIAGFDIIYSLLDLEFDQKEGLYSLPACFGVKISLVVSCSLHMFTVIFLCLAFDGYIYLFGVLVMLIVLTYEHWIVKPDDLSRVNLAFFNVNGLASIIFLAFTCLEVITR